MVPGSGADGGKGEAEPASTVPGQGQVTPVKNSKQRGRSTGSLIEFLDSSRLASNKTLQTLATVPISARKCK